MNYSLDFQHLLSPVDCFVKPESLVDDDNIPWLKIKLQPQLKHQRNQEKAAYPTTLVAMLSTVHKCLEYQEGTEILLEKVKQIEKKKVISACLTSLSCQIATLSEEILP